LPGSAPRMPAFGDGAERRLRPNAPVPGTNAPGYAAVPLCGDDKPQGVWTTWRARSNGAPACGQWHDRDGVAMLPCAALAEPASAAAKPDPRGPGRAATTRFQ